ncbi:hypothetical protein [Labilithrix luteola]|nr:hypothetical protein [Labilithrix luteola]
MRVGTTSVREVSGLNEMSPSAAERPAASATPEVGAKEGPSPFAAMVRGLGKEVDQGERMVRKAVGSGGQDLGPAELIALQAGVYRYSEAVDLAAKLVDRASSGVKTVIQGQ